MITHRIASRLGGRTTSGRFTLWLALIALGGLAIRLVYVFGWKNPGWELGDAVYYHEGANLLAEGKGYIHPYHYLYGDGLRLPGADHPPGYLTVLAGFSLLGFRTFLEHQVVSCLLGAGGVVVFGLAGRRIAGERVGLLAALLVAVNPNVWFHDSAVMSETLVVATTGAVLLTAYRWWDRPSAASAAWFGAAVGAASLVRSEALLVGVLVAIPLVLWQRSRPPAVDAAGTGTHGAATLALANADDVDAPRPSGASHPATETDDANGTALPRSAGGDGGVGRAGARAASWRGLLVQLVVVAGAALLVVGPWVAYNVSRFEHPVTLSSQLDQTLVAANCEEVYYGPNTGYWWPQCMQAVDPLLDPLDDASEEGPVFRRVARDYITNHQRRAVVVVGARVARTFGLYQPENQIGLDQTVDGKEKGLGQAGLLTWYAVAIAGAAGLLGLRRAGRPIFPIVAVVVATAVTVAVTYGATRFRLPAELALCLPAAVSVDAALGHLRRRWQARQSASRTDEEATASGPADRSPNGRSLDESSQGVEAPVTSASSADLTHPTGGDAMAAAEVPAGGGVELRGTSADVPAGLGSSGGRFAGFDGLRAVAALGVLLTHVSLASGLRARTSAGPYLDRADVGVALFFALSGFLLYRPFVSARLDRKPGPGVRHYLRNRLLRILPAYWLALTVLAVVLDVRRINEAHPPVDFVAGFQSPWDFVMYYGLLQSYSESTALGGLQQAWTLTNELAFYLILPLWAAGMAWLSRKLGSPRRALGADLTLLVAAAAGSLGFRWWLHTFEVNDPTTGSFDPRFHWIVANFALFVPGMALAVAHEWSRRQEQPLRGLELVRRHPLVCWALAGVCFWAVASQLDLTALGVHGPGQAVGKELLYAAVGLLLLAPVALAGGTLPRSLRWLGTRVMVTLGVLSYGIYLWHEGVIDIYRDMRDIESPDGTYLLAGSFPEMLVTVLAGTIAVAALSYVVVERPALRLKDRDRRLFANWRPVALPPDAHVEPRSLVASAPELTPSDPASPPVTTAARTSPTEVVAP